MAEVMYDKPIVNKSGETIPAYAVMQADDYEAAGGLAFIRCIKPDEDGKTYLLNGPRDVADGERSLATSALSHLGAYALYDGSTAPAKNEVWGPKAGSWKLNQGEGFSGFIVVGDVHSGRVRVAGSGGSGGGTAAGNVGMVFGDIPLAHSWADMGSGSPSLSWTVSPGQVGPPLFDDGTEWNENVGVLLFDWKRVADTKEEYILEDGTLAPYAAEFQVMTPVVELANGNRRWAWRRCINRSKTDIRASSAEPILVAGYEQVIVQGSTYRLFIITDVMDFRALPGFVVGTAPTGDDDPDLQIPYHSGGEDHFKLDSQDCAGA